MDTVILIFAILAAAAGICACLLAFRALKRLRQLEAKLVGQEKALLDAQEKAHTELSREMARQKHMLSEGLSSLNENFARSVIHSTKTQNG